MGRISRETKLNRNQKRINLKITKNNYISKKHNKEDTCQKLTNSTTLLLKLSRAPSAKIPFLRVFTKSSESSKLNKLFSLSLLKIALKLLISSSSRLSALRTKSSTLQSPREKTSESGSVTLLKSRERSRKLRDALP